jgi:hypothetical protein
MELCGGFVGCMPGWMLVNPGDIGLALDTQVILRWRFFCFSQQFLWPVGAGLASVPAAEIAKGNPATRNAGTFAITGPSPYPLAKAVFEAFLEWDIATRRD